MKRPVYGKTLPKDKAASVFLLEDPSVARDQLTMSYCSDLVRWKARASTISELLSLPPRTITRILKRELGGEGRFKGNMPKQIEPFYARPQLHLEASQFQVAYTVAVHVRAEAPDASGVVVRAFMTAYRHTMECIAKEPELSPEHARVVATSHHSGEIGLARCPTCRMYHTQSREQTVVENVPTRGACPYCRLTASGGVRCRVVLTDAHAELMRQMLGVSTPKA